MSPTNLSRRGLLRAASSVAAASTVVALPIAAFPAAAAPVTSDTSDAELLALGEKLKPLLVEEFNLRPKYDRAYQRASDAGGYMKLGTGKDRTEKQQAEADRRFEEESKRSGYDRLCAKMNSSQNKQRKLARAILKIETQPPV